LEITLVREDHNNLVNKRIIFFWMVLILVLSAWLFARAWWEHWLYLVILSSGAGVIVGCWVHRRGVASPFNLLAAALLLVYYTEIPEKIASFLTVERSPSTYDAVLYYVDRSFGFAPSILVCHWVGSIPHLNQFFFGVYLALSLAMGVCYAAHMGQARPPWSIVVLLFATATVGVLCYNLLPACGPLMLLGAPDFLHGNAFAISPITQPAVVFMSPHFARNAMPSLHMTWVLILVWISRDLRRGHWLAAIFALLTAVATLSTGEHYLVDLVVAFPFAFAIWNLFVGNTPLSHPRRTLSIAVGTSVYLAWIGVIQFDPGLFYISPVIPWLASLATVTGTLYAVYSLPPIDFANRKNSQSEFGIVCG
jgi:hypothetical protein